MSSSNVPSITFTQTGLSVPTTNDVLNGIMDDINSAFGGGLNKDLSTPQGQLAMSITDIITQKNAEFVNLTNQFDPLYADGTWQDALGRIYFLTRNPAEATVVDVVLGGVAGTIVPVGALAKDTNGNIYSNLSPATIGLSGNVTSTFANLTTGAIACPAGTLTIVGQAINGWDSITNPTDGTIGNDVESRVAFETRRQQSVAINANGTVGAIYANVFAVSGVLDCYVIDNPSTLTVNTGATNYPIAPKSVYVAVVGGADEDIAKAIWRKKDVGCGYNGNTTTTVTDTSGYSYPYPTYSVKFERPSALPIKFEVSVVNSAYLPSDFKSQVKTAIIARFNGLDGTQRERIAANVVASRYYSAVQAISVDSSIVSILIGTSTANQNIVISGIDQYPTISASDITVTLV